MIEKLTKENLIKYDFKENHIALILAKDNLSDLISATDAGYFVVSTVDQKIYSGIDAYRKSYFKDKDNVQFPLLDLDLVPEYYRLKQAAYLATQKEMAGNIFNEKDEINQFKKNETAEINGLIEQSKIGRTPAFIKTRNEKYGIYLKWLDRLDGNPTITIKKPQKKVNKLHTYNWIGKPQNITVLHKAMKGIFIDKDTKVKDFCSIFENVDTSEIKPIKWIRYTTDLLLFLFEMMEAGLIKKEIKRMNYKRLNACFCKEDGSHFNEALRTIFQQIKDSITAKKTDIKELVKSVK